MSMDQSELKKEKEYLEKVKEVLKSIIDEAKKHVEYSVKDINGLKRFMWDNLSDYTDEERALALYEVDHSVDITNQQISSISKYEKALNSPYFGKIVFKEENDDEELDIYIGLTSVQNKIQFYVYDWRAPVSSMFYNYELGSASYNTPGGKVCGEILSKTQFKIVDGKMVRCFSSDINIDDEYLQEILVTSSSDKMKNIVSTIQREQNTIIRNDKDKYLIVQGAAGSGKTSVALHRIAYLLYKDIYLKSNNVLILSPSDVFSDYISNVLPELGEQNVLTSTFSEFASSYLKPYKNIENYSQFLERVYNKSAQENHIIEYKMSTQYEKDLNDFIKLYENSISFSYNIKMGNNCISAQELKKLFMDKFKKFPFKERLELLSEYVCNRLGLAKKTYMNRIKKQLQESSGLELDYYNLYLLFLKNQFKNQPSSILMTNNQVPYEDISGLLYMYFTINGYPNYNHIRQVVIDEAQDYTSFQINIMKNIFKNSAFTVLGDINQSLNPFNNETLYDISNLFSSAKYIELTKTYRSSQEIIDYSNQILNINNACSVRRPIDIPVEIKTCSKQDIFSNLREDIENMKNNRMNKIAVITRTNNQAKKIFKELSNYELPEIQLISSSDTQIKESIIVIPSYLSKGLEFDGVIAYNDLDDSYRSGDEKLYYVVCTRAQNQLTIYNEPQKILKRNPNR